MSREIFQPEAEIAVLSILLKNPELYFELHSIKSDMFSSTPNKVLFETIGELLNQKLVPELNLILSYLKTANRDAIIGGSEYLNYLYKQIFNSDNLKEFERIVVDSFKSQTLLSLSASIPGLVSTTESIDDLINIVKKDLDQLTLTTGGDLTSTFENSLRESWEAIEKHVLNPGINGITTGIKNLDLATNGINSGNVWIIAGRPGMGKSAQLCNMAYAQAKAGIPVLIFSFEMSKAQLSQRIISIETNIPSTDIRFGFLKQSDIDKITDSIKEIKDYPIYIDSNFSAKPDYVFSTVRKYVKLYGIKVVYIDYIQLLSERNTDSTNELGRISRMAKILSNELGISVILYSQLNRLVELRDDKRPILSDLRQSGNLEEDADVVVGLYRDIIYNKNTEHKDTLELLLLKQREGPVGTVFSTFNSATYKITDK